MLKLQGLQVRGLAPIDLQMAPGDRLVVRGPSGSGKSLLLRAIADLDPAAGEVSLGDRPRSAMKACEWRRLVRYVAAESGWWEDTVGDHFDDPARAAQRAASLGLPDKVMQQPVAHLSTGERQRLAFIRATADNPPVLLLDEPTSALDAKGAERLETEILRLSALGAILVIVTHDAEQGERLATHFLLIDGGQARFSAR
jgi:phosphate-transporting ATPase